MEKILEPLFKDEESNSGGNSFLLGETGPGGGIIFYHNPEGFAMADGGTCYYLEVALAETANLWATVNTSVPGTGGNIGDGRKNTGIIIATLTAPIALAADFCVTGTHGDGTKTDWFLPSIGELEKLYQWKDVNSISGFQPNNYWSSTQFTLPTHVEGINFLDGSPAISMKNSVYNLVRPIRAF